jgi:hypothetical protein
VTPSLIFVQLASYRDPQLNPTLEDMLRNARHPRQLRIGICHQYHPSDAFDDLKRYANDDRFRIVSVPYLESKGVCWARNMVQRLFKGEEYTLQIDSHMRFAKDWDHVLVTMLQALVSKGFAKPLLTGYVPPFEPGQPLRTKGAEIPLRMVYDRFSSEGIIFTKAAPILNWQQLKSPIRARFLSAGFLFTLGRFCTEVRYDPGLYFHGEEISMAVRAFTSGYDLFHPHRTILWHYYLRPRMPKHWNDHPNWSVWDNASVRKTRQLLGMSSGKGPYKFGAYGLGSIRTLEAYEKYAGISFSRRKAQR